MDADVLARMLEKQTQQIMEHNRKAVADAVGGVENRLRAQVEKIESGLATHIKRVEQGLQERLHETNVKIAEVQGAVQDIDALKQECSRLWDKVGELRQEADKRGEEPGDDRPPGVIFGGWGPLATKQSILADLREAIDQAQVGALLDSDPWVPGRGKQYALTIFCRRRGENEDQLRRRMLDVVSRMQADQWRPMDDGQPGRRIWTSISRSPKERSMGQHASKNRKLLYLLKRGVQGCETHYGKGSVWLDGYLLGSATEPVPASRTAAGRLQGSWIDITVLAKITRMSEQEVVHAWDGAWTNN